MFLSISNTSPFYAKDHVVTFVTKLLPYHTKCRLKSFLVAPKISSNITQRHFIYTQKTNLKQFIIIKTSRKVTLSHFKDNAYPCHHAKVYVKSLSCHFKDNTYPCRHAKVHIKSLPCHFKDNEDHSLKC